MTDRRRLAVRSVTAVTLMAVLLLGLMMLLAPRQARQMLGGVAGTFDLRGGGSAVLATAAPDGAYHQFGTLLAKHLEARDGSELELRPSAGSLQNIALLRSGVADFALIQGGLTEDLSGFESVATLGRQYVHVIVPADSPVTTFRELAGRRIGAGPEHGGSAALAREVLAFFNFDTPPELVFDHGPLDDAFADGVIDAAFMVYSTFAPAMELLLATGYYRLLPMDEARALAAYLPGVWEDRLPHGVYGPNRTLPEEGLTTIAVDTLLVTRSATPGRKVRRLLTGLYDVDFLWSARLHRLTEEQGRQTPQLPLHPAAAAFYGRNDPVSSDRFEIASFFLAGLVCVTSAVHYLVGRRLRRLSERRRRAITPFFEYMLGMGESVEAAGDPETLQSLIHQMMAEQRQAERAWLAGELDTEHMENLYAVYNIRTQNAYSKMMRLQLQRLEGVPAGAPPLDPAPARETYAPAPEEDQPMASQGWREAAAWDGIDEGIVGEVRVRRKSPEAASRDAVIEPSVTDDDGEEQLTLF